LHHLKQSRLGFRRRPIDLVGQDQIGEQGTGANFEFARFLIVNETDGNIARKQIRGKLDALKIQAGHLRNESSNDGFGQHRHIFN
jgi:hypothetical protein